MKRYRFVGELVAMYAFVCFLGWLLNGGAWSFPGQALHPFLLIIAIEAHQYGLRPALLASAAGLVLYILGAPSLSGQDSLPLLAILASGVVLGLTQEARNRQLRQTRGELARSHSEQDNLRQRIAVLSQANKELNERILGEVNTVSSFSEIARRLSVLDRADLYQAICDLVNDYLSASRSTVYAVAGQALELKSSRGFVVVPSGLDVITDHQSLAWMAVSEKQALSALDLLSRRKATGENTETEGLLEGEHPILLAAPIIDQATGLATGVVCVNNLPFSKFHGASKKILDVIARWAGDALHNASIVEELREKATQKG